MPSGFRQAVCTAFVSAGAPNVTTVTGNVSAQTSAGNTLIGSFKSSGGIAVTGVTDSQGNTWAADIQSPGGGPLIAIIRAVLTKALGTSDTITVTIGSAANTLELLVCEYYGAYQTLDVSHGAFSGSNVSAVTIAGAGQTAHAPELVVSAVGTGGSDTGQTYAISAATPALTVRLQGGSPSAGVSAMADGPAAALLTPSASWSWTDASTVAAAIATYVTPPSPPSSSTPRGTSIVPSLVAAGVI